MKAETQRRTQNPQNKATKIFKKKASLWRQNSFIVLFMHACGEFILKSSDKLMLTRKKSFPFNNQVLHRPWKAPIKGFKISLILNSSVTGVGVKFLPWKKKVNDQLLVLFFLANFHVYMSNGKIFELLISQPVKAEAVYYIRYR